MCVCVCVCVCVCTRTYVHVLQGFMRTLQNAFPSQFAFKVTLAKYAADPQRYNLCVTLQGLSHAPLSTLLVLHPHSQKSRVGQYIYSWPYIHIYTARYIQLAIYIYIYTYTARYIYGRVYTVYVRIFRQGSHKYTVLYSSIFGHLGSSHSNVIRARTRSTDAHACIYARSTCTTSSVTRTCHAKCHAHARTNSNTIYFHEQARTHTYTRAAVYAWADTHIARTIRVSPRLHMQHNSP